VDCNQPEAPKDKKVHAKSGCFEGRKKWFRKSVVVIHARKAMPLIRVLGNGFPQIHRNDDSRNMT
jgi:hypothetical protein